MEHGRNHDPGLLSPLACAFAEGNSGTDWQLQPGMGKRERGAGTEHASQEASCCLQYDVAHFSCQLS